MIFLFWGSFQAHLEPKLQLFEVDDHGDAGNDDLSHHHFPNFKHRCQSHFSLHENQKQQRLENLTNRRSGLDIEASPPPVVPNLDNGDEPVGGRPPGKTF